MARSDYRIFNYKTGSRYANPNQDILTFLNRAYDQFKDRIDMFNSKHYLSTIKINYPFLQFSDLGIRPESEGKSSSHNYNPAIDVSYVNYCPNSKNGVWDSQQPIAGERITDEQDIHGLCCFGIFLMQLVRNNGYKFHVAISRHNKHIHRDVLSDRIGLTRNEFLSGSTYYFQDFDFGPSVTFYGMEYRTLPVRKSVYYDFAKELNDELVEGKKASSSSFSLILAILGFFLILFLGKKLKR